MSKLDKELSAILGLQEPGTIVNQALVPVAERSPDETILPDFDQVRTNLDIINKKGLEVFERMAELATETEDVKAIEALGTLMEKLVKGNLAVLEAHERKRKVIAADTVKPNENNPSIVNIDNRKVIMGTTEEVLRQIRNNESTD